MSRNSIHVKCLLVIFSFLCFFKTCFANPNIEYVCENGVELKLETIENINGIKIIKVDDGETVWFRVIAAIFTAFLPETVHAICVGINGDSKACDVVYAATSALVSLGGRQIYKTLTKQGTTHGRRWIVRRGTQKSEAIIETANYDRARIVRRVFNAYRNKGCINWDSVNDLSTSELLYLESSQDGCGLCLKNAPKYLKNYSHSEQEFNRKYWEKGFHSESKRYYMYCKYNNSGECAYWLSINRYQCQEICEYGAWEKDKVNSQWVKRCYANNEEVTTCNQVKYDPCLAGCNWTKEQKRDDGKYYSKCISKRDSRTVCDEKIVKQCPENPDKCDNCYVLSSIKKIESNDFILKFPSPIGYGTNGEKYMQPAINKVEIFGSVRVIRDEYQINANCRFCRNNNSNYTWEDAGKVSAHVGRVYKVQQKVVFVRDESGENQRYICAYVFKVDEKTKLPARPPANVVNEKNLRKKHRKEKRQNGWLKTLSGIVTIGGGLGYYYLTKDDENEGQ